MCIRDSCFSHHNRYYPVFFGQFIGRTHQIYELLNGRWCKHKTSVVSVSASSGLTVVILSLIHILTMTRNEKDARFIDVVLTEKGRALVQSMMEQMGSHSEKDTMSREDLETILKGLKCLEKYLQS